MFVESETTVACISGMPATRNLGATGNRARTQMLELMERYGGSRLLFHCNTDPQRGGEPQYMAQAKMEFPNIAAWKGYPLGGTPNGLANDNLLNTYVKAARDLGIKIIAMHRGISGDAYTGPNSPLDVVRAAKAAPDIKFLVYHGGWSSKTETGYDPKAPSGSLDGVDRLIRAMEENQLPPNSNVYAELGTTWRNLAQQPQNAAHVIGKLLRYVGEDRVLWGTDCVMGGSPAGQIAAMRRLVIPEMLQQAHGYPALTDQIAGRSSASTAPRPTGSIRPRPGTSSPTTTSAGCAWPSSTTPVRCPRPIGACTRGRAPAASSSPSSGTNAPTAHGHYHG